jgi:hypothetical protein
LDPGRKPERNMVEVRLVLQDRKFDGTARSGIAAPICSSCADASAGVITARNIGGSFPLKAGKMHSFEALHRRLLASLP